MAGRVRRTPSGWQVGLSGSQSELPRLPTVGSWFSSMIVFAVVCGVIFPAVWFKKPTRRRVARAALEILWTRRSGRKSRS